jgi:hypothetical protein
MLNYTDTHSTWKMLSAASMEALPDLNLSSVRRSQNHRIMVSLHCATYGWLRLQACDNILHMCVPNIYVGVNVKLSLCFIMSCQHSPAALPPVPIGLKAGWTPGAVWMLLTREKQLGLPCMSDFCRTTVLFLSLGCAHEERLSLVTFVWNPDQLHNGRRRCWNSCDQNSRK